jgi:cation:H+ antiporter
LPNVLYDSVLILIGLVLVATGGDLFVDSSVYIGKALRIPRIIIGGTLVSLATTMPELVVSALASSAGDSGIALGNAVGSCICNVGLIVGTLALLTPVEVERRDFSRRVAWMLSAAVLVVIFTFDRTLSRPLAGVLMALAFVYLAWDYLNIRRYQAEASADESAPPDTSQLSRSIGMFALGAGLILIGSNFLVTSGQALAAALGVPSIIIGLSVVAVGTSLPELVTGVSAARKGVPDLSLGNIIGANILNLYLIVGLSGTIHPLTLDAFTQFYSFGWLAVFFTAVVALAARTGRFHRSGGLVLLALYVVYLAGLVVLPMAGVGL